MTTRIKLNIQKKDRHALTFGPVEKRKFDEFVGQLPAGCYTLEIQRSVKEKTQNQLGAHFGLMIASAIEKANDIGLDTSTFLQEMVKSDLPSGIGLTSDFLKEIFYCLCPIFRDGKRITLSKASTLEASKHFEDCRNLLAAHGIYIQEPNKNWKDEQ